MVVAVPFRLPATEVAPDVQALSMDGSDETDVL